jgi:hypothetical protein
MDDNKVLNDKAQEKGSSLAHEVHNCSAVAGM